jgi:hypothetical protein
MPDDIVHVPEEHVKLGMLDVAPEQVVNRATKIANALADVIKKKGLSSRIRNKDYVRVEGWSTLGAMIGILPKEKYVKEIDNGYEAYVDLIRASDGVVTGGASAICTRDEKNWGDRDDFAVRSMAITRATGKAYRLGLAWIMELAGYSGTPAEEMYGIFDEDVVEGKVKEVKPKKKAAKKKEQPPTPDKAGVERIDNQWEEGVLDKIKELDIVAVPHAVNRLNLSVFRTTVPYGELTAVQAVAYILCWSDTKKKEPDIESEARARKVDMLWPGWETQATDLIASLE